MRKIPTIFHRGADHLATEEVNPEALWVFGGDGNPTRQYDGTACLVKDRWLYRRYDVKGKRKPPKDFMPAEERDPDSRHWFGWMPIGVGAEDRLHREAIANGMPPDGTYELCGPKVWDNPEGFEWHCLIRHGSVQLQNVPRHFAKLRKWLKGKDIEGVVWHHPDGRMAKIKKRDFGLNRKD